MNQKSLLPILLVPAGILTIPAMAMLLNVEGWAWSLFDFVLMGLLIAGAVTAYQFVAGQSPNRLYRFAAGIAVVTALVLVWINGAVGLIGSENNPANLMHGAVLGIGLVGAVLARLRPEGMARAMAAMATAQLLVPVVALMLWRADFSPGVVEVFALNAAFAALFACSALLFRRAGALAAEPAANPAR